MFATLITQIHKLQRDHRSLHLSMVKPHYNFGYVICNQNHMCPPLFRSAPTGVLRQPSQNALKELHDITTDG